MKLLPLFGVFVLVTVLVATQNRSAKINKERKRFLYSTISLHFCKKEAG